MGNTGKSTEHIIVIVGVTVNQYMNTCQSLNKR